VSDAIQLSLKVGTSLITIPVSRDVADAMLALAREADPKPSAEVSPPDQLPTWYVVNRWGGAWPCPDEAAARRELVRRNKVDQFNAPHAVRRLVDPAQPS
jgi:hypothetical protein